MNNLQGERCAWSPIGIFPSSPGVDLTPLPRSQEWNAHWFRCEQILTFQKRSAICVLLLEVSCGCIWPMSCLSHSERTRRVPACPYLPSRLQGLRALGRFGGPKVLLLSCLGLFFFFFLFVCFPSQISRKRFHPKTKGIQTFLMCCRIKLREKNIQTQPIHFI